jgi:hypothetical protein
MQWAGYVELFVALLFLAGLGVIELVGRRLDRKREDEKRRQHDPE